MKIMKMKILILMLAFALPYTASAQCTKKLDFHRLRVKQPWAYNNLSKSATCTSGNQYEFVLTLTKGKDYRIQFFAASVFNNTMNFKIIDMSTQKTVMDLPGNIYEPGAGKQVLTDYFDEDRGKMIHPYFDFFPASTAKLKIIIDIPVAKQEIEASDSYQAPEQKNRGCLTVLVLDKPASGGW